MNPKSCMSRSLYASIMLLAVCLLIPLVASDAFAAKGPGSNRAPVVNNQSFSVSENSPAGTVVGTVAQSQSVENQLKGVSVQSLTPQLKDSLNVPKRIGGVVVTDIDEDSPAEGALIKNDIIIEVNRKQIGGVKDYEEAVSGIRQDENILLLVFRKGSTLYVTLSAK